MKRVYTAELIPQVAHVRNLLEQAGIDCQLRNERLGGVTGEIPFLETWPQLWVQDGDEARARQLLADLAAAHTVPATEWACSCGEHSGGQFSECWSCGAARPGGYAA
jgi:hypothetical protein